MRVFDQNSTRGHNEIPEQIIAPGSLVSPRKGVVYTEVGIELIQEGGTNGSYG